MKERFEGEEGHRRALEVLVRNAVVVGDRGLASALLEACKLSEYARGQVLMKQDEHQAEVAFLLTGRVEVLVNGRSVAERAAPAHVGEMAAIDPKEQRSATVRALTPTVVAWISDADLTRIAVEYPELWRGFARELADRLRQRNKFHSPPNTRPRMFIGSSVEGLAVARAIQLTMEYDAIEIEPWMARTFRPSSYTIPDLLAQVEVCDFAVFCLSPDDLVTSRDGTLSAPRDNVLFEVGLFMGRLGQGRVFIVKPRGVALKLPSDMAGLSPLDYRVPDPGKDVSVESLCEEMRRAIGRAGTR